MNNFFESLLRQFLDFCGLEQLSWFEVPGLMIVLLALFLVIYAFQRAVTYSIWPQEPHYDHIKNSILEEGRHNEN